MSQQIAVRLSDELLAALDWVVVRVPEFDSRADAVRAAIESMVEQERRKAEGEAIRDAYIRVPVTDEELEFATRAGDASIEEEPWEKWW